MKAKEFYFDGCVNVSEEMSHDQFMDEFLELIESKGWLYGGGISPITYDEDGKILVNGRPGGEKWR